LSVATSGDESSRDQVIAPGSRRRFYIRCVQELPPDAAARPAERSGAHGTIGATRRSEGGSSMAYGETRTAGKDTTRLATALGAFSVGLGLAELTAPRAVARAIGTADDGARMDRVLRAFGVRELLAGAGILGMRDPKAGLWSRVAGDVMDLAFLGGSFGRAGSQRGRLAAATAAVAAVTALDVLASRRASARTKLARNGTATGAQPVDGPAVITINRGVADVYAFWRRLENLPLFMPHLRSVEVIDERWSHWVANAVGTTIEWRAEIVSDEPERRIAWRSVEDADVPNEGEVAFRPAPGGRGTEVRVRMAYSPPAGAVGAAFAKMLGSDPGQRMRGDLRRLKQILETGEIPTTVGQTRGARSVLGAALEPLEQGSQS
jgi:uncharacterized membrane protein